MITISLCMIVKDEEDVLARCLESARPLVEEIIVVDTGSSDATKAIAAGYADQVHDFVWQDDFALARNVSFSKATQEYVMWLDADDVIEGENAEKLLLLKQTLDDDTDVVMLPYHISFEGEKPVFTYYRERIVKRGKFLWEEPVHEVISPKGKIVYGEAAISHRKLKPAAKGRNLNIYEKQRKDGKKLSPRAQFYYSRELMYAEQFEQATQAFLTFLKEDQGWVENRIEACKNLAWCYRAMGKDEDALQALYGSFLYAGPRAEIVCDIGDWFISRSLYAQACFWYETALRLPLEAQKGGFCLPDCYGFLPNLQLCVCHYHLGNYFMAMEYNEAAERFRPDHPSVLHNKILLDDLVNPPKNKLT